MAEYGATSNYNLPFPTDEADTDIAGDIKRLAEAVDNVISAIDGGGSSATVTNLVAEPAETSVTLTWDVE